MSGKRTAGEDREMVHVQDPPKRIFGNVLLDGADGQCVYIYSGIEERCPNDAVAYTYIHGDRVEMCAEHCPEDVPEPPATEQQQLLADGGEVEVGIECPEYCCPHTWPDRESLEAHLRWDHNRSEFKAEQLAHQALQDGICQSGGASS